MLFDVITIVWLFLLVLLFIFVNAKLGWRIDLFVGDEEERKSIGGRFKIFSRILDFVWSGSTSQLNESVARSMSSDLKLIRRISIAYLILGFAFFIYLFVSSILRQWFL